MNRIINDEIILLLSEVEEDYTEELKILGKSCTLNEELKMISVCKIQFYNELYTGEKDTFCRYWKMLKVLLGNNKNRLNLS